MTRDQLRLRYIAALNRHWRASLDHSGPTPALLDELVTIAEEHATAHAERVTARHELREEAAAPIGDIVGYRVGGQIYHPADVEIVRHGTGAPPPVAAALDVATGGPGHAFATLHDGTITGGGGAGDDATATGATGGPGAPSAAHRTRTRTRGGPK